jgi:hypothetical protein
VAVAESMENALKEIWRREVGKFAEEYRRTSIQSAMSSPVGSISGSVRRDVNDAFVNGPARVSRTLPRM